MLRPPCHLRKTYLRANQVQNGVEEHPDGATQLAWALLAQPVFADHESRDRVLSDSGIEVLLVVLLLGAAIVTMGAFAAGILWWERQDSDPADPETPA